MKKLLTVFTIFIILLVSATNAAAEALPDLVIDSIAGYSAYGLPQLSVTVKNTGSATAYFNRRFQFSVTPKDREGNNIEQPRPMTLDSWDSIRPGQTKTFNSSSGSYAGAASVVVKIDTDNAVSESNESNNEKSQAIAIPKADLVIVSIEPRADFGIEQFIVKVKNQGGIQANFNNRFQFSVTAKGSQGNVIGEPRVTTLPYSNWNTIAPGETKAFTYSGGYPETAFSVTFKIDTNNTVSESNESNNEKSVNMADMPKPDLIIDSITPLSVSGIGQFSVKVKNIGNAQANFNNRFQFSATPKDSQGNTTSGAATQTLSSWNTIDANQTKTFTFSSGAFNNADTVVFKVDTNNTVSESNESNNEKSVNMADMPKPDLIIDSIEPRTDSGIEQFRVTVKNIGTALANFNNRFQFSATPKDSQGNIMREPVIQTLSSWNTIDANQTKVFTSLSGSFSNADTIVFKVDTANAVSESNETNNEKSVKMADMPIILDKPKLLAPACENYNAANNTFSVTWSWPEKEKANDYWLQVFDQSGNTWYFNEWTKKTGKLTSYTIPSVTAETPIFAQYLFTADYNNLSSWSDKALVVCVKPSVTPTPIASASASLAPSPIASLSPSPSASASGSLLTYPIAELGNCKDKEDCARYCDLDENFNACNEYAVKMGLRTRGEAERLRNARNVKSGPGGCNSQESCAVFCDKQENLNVCLEYAEKHNLMSADELDKTKKVLKIISSGTKTPGDCKTPKGCQKYCTGDGSHIKECIEFAKGAGLMSAEEANQTEKGDFLRNGGPGGCKSREECESYCENDDHAQECEAFFKNAGVPDSKSGDRSGKPPKTGGGAVCTTREECEAFCKNPANAEACKNVVIKGGQTTGPQIQGDIGKLLENINQMPQESKECLKQALGAETFEKVMRGEMPTTPISGDVMQSCFAKGVEEYEKRMEPTKKPDDFSTGYGPGPGYQYDSEGNVEKIPQSAPTNPGGVPEVQGVSAGRSLLNVILDWFRR